VKGINISQGFRKKKALCWCNHWAKQLSCLACHWPLRTCVT